MKRINGATQLWTERYRPQLIVDCILPPRLKESFQSFADDGEIPNMLLCGGAGQGKTTIAKALCSELGATHILINASLNRGIDEIRTTVKNFSSTVSLESSDDDSGRSPIKVVIFDEFDSATPEAQLAIRALQEQFYDNCRYIFTCNFKNKVILPIHSRCTVIDFHFTQDETAELMKGMFKRTRFILNEFDIQYDPKVVAALIKKCFPDFRRTLNELQRYSKSGAIDISVLADIDRGSYVGLIDHIKDKDWKWVRQWVVDNQDLSTEQLYSSLEDIFYKNCKNNSAAQACILLAQYQHYAATAANQTLNTTAMLTEIMASCEF